MTQDPNSIMTTGKINMDIINNYHAMSCNV